MTNAFPLDLPGIARFAEERIAFNRFLGIRVENISEGFCKVVLPWSDKLLGDPFRSTVHGGVLATLVDVAGGAACFTKLTSPGDRLSTVDLRIDYLQPGKPGEFSCDANILRMGNRVAVVRMEVYSHADPTPLLVAVGQGVYNVVRREA